MVTAASPEYGVGVNATNASNFTAQAGVNATSASNFTTNATNFIFNVREVQVQSFGA
jgi:hypothetical protein